MLRDEEQGHYQEGGQHDLRSVRVTAGDFLESKRRPDLVGRGAQDPQTRVKLNWFG